MNHDLILPSRREWVWGWRYLLFNLVFLGDLMYLALGAVWPTMDSATYNFIYFTINFLAVVILFRKFWLRTLRAAWEKAGSILTTALCGFGAYRILSIPISIVIAFLAPEFSNVNDQGVGELAQQNYLLIALGSCFLVPVAEELLYRGVVFGSIFRRRPVLAYAVSICMFAFIHISGYVGCYPTTTLLLCFLQYIPAGLCLAAAYQISGSILTPILIHMAVNAIGILAMR